MTFWPKLITDTTQGAQRLLRSGLVSILCCAAPCGCSPTSNEPQPSAPVGAGGAGGESSTPEPCHVLDGTKPPAGTTLCEPEYDEGDCYQTWLECGADGDLYLTGEGPHCPGLWEFNTSCPHGCSQNPNGDMNDDGCSGAGGAGGAGP